MKPIRDQGAWGAKVGPVGKAATWEATHPDPDPITLKVQPGCRGRGGGSMGEAEEQLRSVMG